MDCWRAPFLLSHSAVLKASEAGSCDGDQPCNAGAALRGAASQAPTAPTSRVSESQGWVPLGPLPVDEAGTTGRGYQAPPDGAGLVEPGRNQIALHLAAANYLYGEERAGFRIAEKFETHTAAIEFRRGFSNRVLRRFELGGQLQVHRNTEGFLNGFIGGFEKLVARTTGHQSAVNTLRTDLSRDWPLINLVEKDGQDFYRREGPVSGLGDVALFVRTALTGDPSAGSATLAARVMVNIAGSEALTSGNYVSAGLSASKRVLGWLALHGDARVSLPIDRDNRAGLPLKRGTVGAMGAAEFRVSQKTSLDLQFDVNGTPYAATGTRAFDRPYSAIELGISRLWGNRVLTQLYGRENMNMRPMQVQPNLDPDFSVGIKLTIR